MVQDALSACCKDMALRLVHRSPVTLGASYEIVVLVLTLSRILVCVTQPVIFHTVHMEKL
jgi:hypothetical protein